MAAARLDFFFSFRSPYSYLAAPRVFALPDRFDVELVFRGVIPMVMRGQSVPRAKSLHTLRDVKREARRLDMPFGPVYEEMQDAVIEERTAQLQQCMYQYSRAIYRSIKDMIEPYADRETQLAARRDVLEACQQTMERLASDPLYFAKPDRALFQDIRRYFPITAQAQVAWAVENGVKAAVTFIQDQIESGLLDGGVARCRATTRKGKPCQRTPLPERDYCPSHQHLEAKLEAKAAA